MVGLGRLTRSWLMTGEGPAALDRIIMDRCIRALPPEAKRWAAQNHPETVDELIDRLGAARFISTLDLTKGYWQVPLTVQAREKTAFATPTGCTSTLCCPSASIEPQPRSNG